MPDRRRLLDNEAAGAAAFEATLARIPDERWNEAAIPPDGWTPVVLLGHMAWWLDECGRVLEAMAAGAWDPATEPEETPESVAATNAEHAARAAALTRPVAEAAVAAARERARAAWSALPEISREAWSWFEESGPNHYAKHVHDLAAWLDGAIADPEIGVALQADAEAWVAFAAMLDAVGDQRAQGAEGWSAVDIGHHVASWMDRASACIEHNAGWGEPYEPEADLPTDEVNARILAAAREITPAQARDGLDRARVRIRAALSSLAEPSAGAKEAFAESTIDHYEEHRPMLERLSGSPGSVP